MSLTSGTSYLSSTSVYAATTLPSATSSDTKGFVGGIPQRGSLSQNNGYLFRNVGEMFAGDDGTAGLLYNNAPPGSCWICANAKAV